MEEVRLDSSQNVQAAHERSAGHSATVELDNVTFAYEPTAGRPAFVATRNISFAARKGEFISIVGPSGCGKSTLLTVIAGLNRPTIGDVRIDGATVTRIRKDVGFIFQRDALLPWRSAIDNVALPLKFRGVNRTEAHDRARDWLNRVGLAKFERSYPHQLSGGMRKRVAIAATMVYRPRILLMDEPFSALDVQTRNLLENDLLALWHDSDEQTVIFVTHDLEEAIGLSDRVIVLSASPGRMIGNYEVPLTRPRDLLEIRFEPGFTDLHAKIWGHLREEVVMTYERETSASRANGGPGFTGIDDP